MDTKKPDQPLFLQSEPDAGRDCQAKNMQNELEKPEEMSWGDYMLKDKGKLSPRHRELARLVASGMGTNDIAKKLNYTVGRVSVLKSNTRITQEIERIQDRILEEDIDKRLKSMNTDAANVMEDILLSADIKLQQKESAARWLLEKTTGKAAQAIDLKGEISVGIFLDQVENLQTTGQIIDVTPQAKTPDQIEAGPDKEDALADWVNSNI